DGLAGRDFVVGAGGEGAARVVKESKAVCSCALVYGKRASAWRSSSIALAIASRDWRDLSTQADCSPVRSAMATVWSSIALALSSRIEYRSRMAPSNSCRRCSVSADLGGG